MLHMLLHTLVTYPPWHIQCTQHIIIIDSSNVVYATTTTLGKRNYFMGYGILLHKLPVVAVYCSTKAITMKGHTVVHVLQLQNLNVVKYGINLVK